MKKLLLLTVISVLGFGTSFAQTTGEVVAGINLSDMSKFDSKIGFHVGARAELMLPSVFKGFYVNGAALFSLKGAEKNNNLYGVKIDSYYLELPIHAGYKYVIDNDLAFFGEFGPYFGLRLFGKSKTSSKIESVNIYTGNVDRFDFGLGFRVGTEINKHFTASVGYDFGLVNVKADNNNIRFPSAKNSNLYVTFGYKF